MVLNAIRYHLGNKHTDRLTARYTLHAAPRLLGYFQLLAQDWARWRLVGPAWSVRPGSQSNLSLPYPGRLPRSATKS